MKNMESRHNDVTEDDSEVSRAQRGHVCLAVAHSRRWHSVEEAATWESARLKRRDVGSEFTGAL